MLFLGSIAALLPLAAIRYCTVQCAVQ